MGYQVHYPPMGREGKRRRPWRRVVLTALAFFLFVQSVRLLWPEGWQVLQQVFLPRQSMEAVTVFVEELKAGTPAQEALTAFCQNWMEASCEMLP